jgi:hypothetical protein
MVKEILLQDKQVVMAAAFPPPLALLTRSQDFYFLVEAEAMEVVGPLAAQLLRRRKLFIISFQLLLRFPIMQVTGNPGEKFINRFFRLVQPVVLQAPPLLPQLLEEMGVLGVLVLVVAAEVLEVPGLLAAVAKEAMAWLLSILGNSVESKNKLTIQ